MEFKICEICSNRVYISTEKVETFLEQKFLQNRSGFLRKKIRINFTNPCNIYISFYLSLSHLRLFKFCAFPLQLFSFKGSKISLNRPWAYESLIHLLVSLSTYSTFRPPRLLSLSLSLFLCFPASSSILCLSIREFILTIWERHRLIWISDFPCRALVSNARARNVWSVSAGVVTNVIFGVCASATGSTGIIAMIDASWPHTFVTSGFLNKPGMSYILLKGLFGINSACDRQDRGFNPVTAQPLISFHSTATCKALQTFALFAVKVSSAFCITFLNWFHNSLSRFVRNFLDGHSSSDISRQSNFVHV